ncbi:hypothetical protein RJ639_036538 [Escallonia herrerae]|uniref:ubiquitinyl hydrolase 1 n=1 Tax=Escallonia herrerae TaxID=1293975 RepID=A0AA89B5V7_9ASTE|nr:hypothetical protein RJ639_036538 [Escallonia herrerae]
MLAAGDLGLSYLVLVELVVSLVIGFVIRRKWLVAAARREEIRRLLVLAAEEAARAEAEAAADYSSVDAPAPAPAVTCRPPYQCAVCFSPTATRCKRCKAVHYCSGKCQIVHWRLGHKDNCRPFTTINQINDVEGASGQKVLSLEDYENSDNSFESEARQYAKLVGSSKEEPDSFNFSYTKNFNKNGSIEVENFLDKKGTNTNKFASRSSKEGSTTGNEPSLDASVSNYSDSDRSDGFQPTGVNPRNFLANSANKDQTMPPFSENPKLVDSFRGSGKFNEIKLSCSDKDTQSKSSSSSGYSVDGSNESSFSEPSTPSSGFWEGTIDSRRSIVDTHDDSARCSSSESGDGNRPFSQSSLSFSFDLAKGTAPSISLQGSSGTGIRLDDSSLATSGVKEAIAEAALLGKSRRDGFKSRRSPSSTERSKHMGVDTCSESHQSSCREPKNSSSGGVCTHPASIATEHSTSTGARNTSTPASLSLERSKNVVDSMSAHTSKVREVGSLSSRASDAHLSSSTERRSAESVKSERADDGVCWVAACSQVAGPPQNARSGLKNSMWKVDDQLRSSKSLRHYPPGELAGKYNFKGLFQYDLFVKLYNWNKVELRPCGLTNCGNSCYANAVLQCLTFTPPLTAYLLQGLHSKSCENEEWCFTCEFESLVLKEKEGHSPLSPIGILSQIQNIGSHLGKGREEDAHEYLRYAIDTMQSACLKEAGAKASGSLEEETTLIGLTFGGYLRSKIKCMKCGGKSERHERMMDLTVEIEGDIGTLEEALRQFTGTETLDGENKYHCSRCKSYEKAKKKLTVLEAPNVLTIALKRFQSGKFGKLNKSIRFPEILNLAPYMSTTSDKSPIYRLYGVVVHLDIMNAAFSGHYVCYVKNTQNKWFKIDDSSVQPVELERVLAKGAYMLLYSRCSPRAPRSIRHSSIPRDPSTVKNPMLQSRSHPARAWDDHLNGGRSRTEHFYPDHIQPRRPILEEDSSSDNSSSLFSEATSCSTESSNRDSTDDMFDHIFGDLGPSCNSPWRNSSDSDTSSSSSSHSPLYTRHSPLADSDRYASECPETSGSQMDHSESAADFWARVPSRSSKVESSEGKGGAPLCYSDMTKQCRKLGTNSSCRETDADRLERISHYENKKSGVFLRRSFRERTD